jgi:hypothetical protein
LYGVALVRTGVSVNMSPPSSRFLRMIGPLCCVTVEPLLIILSTERYNLWSKNTVFRDAFRAVLIIDTF